MHKPLIRLRTAGYATGLRAAMSLGYLVERMSVKEKVDVSGLA